MPSKMASSIIATLNTTTKALNSEKSTSPTSPTKKMSITQTYYLAHTARSKLAKEAARADHDLRLLVGHANMLDSLMLDLANAEREQEQWFNNTVRNATKKSAAQPSHIRWADTIEEESMEDDSDSDSDSDLSDDDYSDYDEEEEEEEKMKALTALYTASAKPLRRAPSPPALVAIDELSSEDEEEDEDEEAENARLTLTRSPSRQQSPPELLDDLSSDEDEEISMPPSPEDVPLDTFSSTATTKKNTNNMLTDSTSQSLFESHDFIHHQGTMIPAY